MAKKRKSNPGKQGGLRPKDMTPGQRQFYRQWQDWKKISGVSGTAKNVARPTKSTTPASTTPGETPEQKAARERQEEKDRQFEEDVALAKTDLDMYFRNAFPDQADRDVLIGLVTGAIRNKTISMNSQTYVDQIWRVVEQTDQYKRRFPGLVARAQRSGNGQVPMTPDEYMRMENMFDAAMATYMIPAGVMDRREAIAKMVENDVTIDEMQARIDMAAEAATRDESFMKKFTEYQGMQPGHLIAFYLDPELTSEKIAKQQRVFEVGAMMDRYNFKGALSDAQRLEDLGLADTAVGTALDKAAARRRLMSGLGGKTTESTLIQGSATKGTEAAELASLEAQRAGRFNRSGGAAESQKGVSGLGQSRAT